MTTAPDVLDVLPTLTDADRLDTLQHTGLLSGEGDPTMDRLARLASALVGAPRAFVTLVTPDRQLLPGMVRHDDPADTSRETPLDESLCQFAVATESPLVIPDSHDDALVRHMAPVRNGHIGAYAGVPLRTSGGHVLGTLCVVDSEPRAWGQDRLALLEDLTALASQQVQQRLGTAREHRLQELAEQLTDRVPPLADAVQSLVDLAEQQEDPRLQRYAALSRSRMSPVERLTRRLAEQVSEERDAPRAAGPVSVDLRAVVGRCVRSARATTGSDVLRLEVEDGALPVRCDVSGLERSITHVLVTALHHTRGGAPVLVRLGGGTADGSTGTGTGRMTVTAEDSRVPTGELARIASRFAQVVCGTATAGREEPASIRLVRGGVVAQSGAVRAEVTRDGRLTLSVELPLDDALSPTGPLPR